MTLSEEVRRACADGPLTAAEVAEATGMDPRTARHTLSRQCYCRFMEATHDVPTRYRVVKEPEPPARPRRADALLAIREGWTSTPEVAGRIGIPGRRAYEVMKRAERRGLVERRHASANPVEWRLTERGMEMMEGMEKMEAMEGCERPIFRR